MAQSDLFGTVDRHKDTIVFTCLAQLIVQRELKLQNDSALASSSAVAALEQEKVRR